VKSKPKKCKHCARTACRRGLCTACYAAAYRRVSSGECSWEDLEELKLCNPPAHRGKPPSPFNVNANKVLSNGGRRKCSR
jgi:hypothetical protein